MEIDLKQLNVRDVLTIWASALSELRDRGLIRTNNLVGDLAEAIVHAHYGGERLLFSGKGWDVKTPDGERIEVKAIRRTSARRVTCSAIRGCDYDAALVVVFDTNFELTDGLKIARETVEALFPHREHVNGRIITVTKRLTERPEVTHVDMTAAYDRLCAPPAAQ
ncbi:MAG: DUF6998 domain-containing protein [Mycobacterium sp.]